MLSEDYQCDNFRKDSIQNIFLRSQSMDNVNIYVSIHSFDFKQYISVIAIIHRKYKLNTFNKACQIVSFILIFDIDSKIFHE